MRSNENLSESGKKPTDRFNPTSVPVIVYNLREEIFGPVVTAIPFSDPAEMVKSANDTRYGLASAVWTRDVSTAHKVAAKLRAGTVWLNCYNVFDTALPFGGYRQFGWGRESGHQALELYTENKAVCAQL